MRIFNLFVIALLLFSCQAQNAAKDIDTEEFLSLVEDENVFVIDVRTPSEVKEAHISLTDYYFNINDANFEKNIASLEKDKTYIVYCRSGKRSTSALNYMEELGFTSLFELKGGILAWDDEDYLTKMP